MLFLQIVLVGLFAYQLRKLRSWKRELRSSRMLHPPPQTQWLSMDRCSNVPFVHLIRKQVKCSVVVEIITCAVNALAHA